MLEEIKPFLRRIKYDYLAVKAQVIKKYWLKTYSNSSQTSNIPFAFIVGCGRSGTTILGNVLSQNPQIFYFFEPYHLWAAIDTITDVLNLYSTVNGSLIMDSSQVSEITKERFHVLFSSKADPLKTKLLVEKTPLNAMRLRYLEALVPDSKYIHIVRDGVDTSCSIAKLANQNTYRIAGKPDLNQWWGVNNSKWKALKHDGAASGYFPDEIDEIADSFVKAAYEWIVSISEVNQMKLVLGDRLKELRYDDLTQNPAYVLKELCEFLEMEPSSSWLQAAISKIHLPKNKEKTTLKLPEKMSKTFNQLQIQYSFQKRAECSN